MLNSARRDLSSRSDETLPVEVDSLGRGRTRPLFDLSVNRDNYLSVATEFELVIFNICIQFLHFAYDL